MQREDTGYFPRRCAGGAARRHLRSYRLGWNPVRGSIGTCRDRAGSPTSSLRDRVTLAALGTGKVQAAQSPTSSCRSRKNEVSESCNRVDRNSKRPPNREADYRVHDPDGTHRFSCSIVGRFNVSAFVAEPLKKSLLRAVADEQRSLSPSRSERAFETRSHRLRLTLTRLLDALCSL
jgi:hypothetical protein